MIQFKTIILSLLTALALACFALSPRAQAVLPPPDGGYPGQTTAEGDLALLTLTTGFDNTALGFEALTATTTGSDNTAVGAVALAENKGSDNTAIGSGAMTFNSTGTLNTATGFAALLSNITGGFNTATGAGALQSNKAFNNTATGFQALNSNTTGGDNTATGLQALVLNTTGGQNTAHGFQALFNNSTGGFNTADGWQTLASNTTAFSNVGTGFQALFSNTTGGANTGSGSQALTSNTTGGGNTAVGFQSLFSNNGSRNIALGVQAGADLTSGSDNIDIGNRGIGGESHTTRIGSDGIQTAVYITGISGAPVVGSPVVVNGVGQLGVAASSARYKEEIKPMDKASEVIMALKPVTFRYKKELDPKSLPQFGLVAEDVAKVNPDLVAHDAKGEVYTVRYDAVNAMLLNEFLKEHQKVQRLEAALAAVNERLKEQDARIDKVNAKVELRNLAPQVANNGQ